jgi:hypothetical protein
VQAICKGIFSKMIYGLKRDALQKVDLKMDFKYYFIKYFIRFQRIILETLFLFLPFGKKALGQNYKVLLKNHFIGKTCLLLS